jgi:hypothetical protein
MLCMKLTITVFDSNSAHWLLEVLAARAYTIIVVNISHKQFISVVKDLKVIFISKFV